MEILLYGWSNVAHPATTHAVTRCTLSLELASVCVMPHLLCLLRECVFVYVRVSERKRQRESENKEKNV